MRAERDAFTPHLKQMRAFNAGHLRIKVGPRASRRLDLVISIGKGGQAVLRNRLTGATAKEHDAPARASLLVEVKPWLEYERLYLRWRLAPLGSPAKERAARAFLRHMRGMKAAGLATEGAPA